ncbi:signal peptidase I [Liquorilactobacillus vini]|uniref:signal peptidase I n=1 Tax=Liquorilactobacillus vini TaxID=238015 RepID=UPI0022875209|nr:signal peptidase I [Liquorilactobacillus vini]
MIVKKISRTWFRSWRFGKAKEAKKFQWRYWLALVFWAGLIALFIRSFLLIPIQIEGNSMEPTLHSKQEVLVISPNKLRRFDIVIFKTSSNVTYVKRVIGLPGDRLDYRNDHLYINGKKISEPFIARETADPNEDYTSDFSLKSLIGVKRVPANEYFVLGDNRRISKDSRTIGPIQKSWITGKVVLIYWPLNQFKWLYQF